MRAANYSSMNIFNENQVKEINKGKINIYGLKNWLGFNINKINPKTKNLIDQTIKNFQKIYSDNCRIYIRPSGTEPVIRVLVEAKNQKKVDSLSSEITKKLFLEIDKIIN